MDRGYHPLPSAAQDIAGITLSLYHRSSLSTFSLAFPRRYPTGFSILAWDRYQ